MICNCCSWTSPSNSRTISCGQSQNLRAQHTGAKGSKSKRQGVTLPKADRNILSASWDMMRCSFRPKHTYAPQRNARGEVGCIHVHIIPRKHPHPSQERRPWETHSQNDKTVHREKGDTHAHITPRHDGDNQPHTRWPQPDSESVTPPRTLSEARITVTCVHTQRDACKHTHTYMYIHIHRERVSHHHRFRALIHHTHPPQKRVNGHKHTNTNAQKRHLRETACVCGHTWVMLERVVW